MLEKEPDNFEALRGKALIAMNITDIAGISSLDLYPKIDYKSASEEIDRAVGSSKPQDREYFTTMKDIVDSGHEYVGEMAQLEKQKTERRRNLDTISEYAKERDTYCIFSSTRVSKKKAAVLTVVCYIIFCLLISLVFMYVNRNPYAKAEDLSKYETTETTSRIQALYPDTNSFDFDAFSNYMKQSEALEREAQRKINYDAWELAHKGSYVNLIYILCIATVIYAVFVFILTKWGKFLNSEIAKLQVKADEQTDKIRSCDKRIDELKDRIGQDYKRLCELHPAD